MKAELHFTMCSFYAVHIVQRIAYIIAVIILCYILTSYNTLSSSILSTVNLFSISFCTRDQVSHPHKVTGNYVIFSTSCYFLPLRSKYSPEYPVLKYSHNTFVPTGERTTQTLGSYKGQWNLRHFGFNDSKHFLN
jgi:hypothetical protein